ncbi:MAG: DNA-binding protein [Candidatus Altiarchaeales archaeon]|nr:MAG: DNA-binding protein [Candidatus Altiarchaeales archaeon]
MTDDELEELRKRRIAQILMMQRQRQLEEQQRLQQQIQEAEQLNAIIRRIMMHILTPEARQRLANIRLVRPDFARQIEIFLIQLYQQGKLPKKITDSQLKEILRKISQNKKETKIKRV